MKTLSLAVLVASTLQLGVTAQSTSGSSGRGTTEPGPSAAEASGFGSTQRSPNPSTGTNTVPRPTGTNGDKINPATSALTFHGSAMTADAIFKALDTNGDGQITREEFSRLQSVMGTTGTSSKEGAGTTGNRKP